MSPLHSSDLITGNLMFMFASPASPGVERCARDGFVGLERLAIAADGCWAAAGPTLSPGARHLPATALCVYSRPRLPYRRPV